MLNVITHWRKQLRPKLDTTTYLLKSLNFKTLTTASTDKHVEQLERS